ncbi:ABC transporter permease [Actinocatenispora rupis]|uniref:ABC transporter permease n=1 Tax=Actinocatenispora rupis TaxID=519421 RepID=A0A8J3NAZ7_9ACTN|nr:ABC transporter permease [Actinocatenispora rupis]GID12844.1 ABC transporter permease [Actinocatenispora rupis]
MTRAATLVAPAPRTAGQPSLPRRIVADRNGLIGVVLVGLLVVVAVVSLVHLGQDPLAQNRTGQLAGPSGAHWLGTDQFGRDIAARVAAGVFASLRVALVSVGMATIVGGLLGVLSGFAGGVLDAVVGRCTDVLFAFPATLLALALVAALGHGWFNTAIAIAVVYTPIFVRVARGPVLTVRESEYVKAGRVLGFSRSRLLFRHVLPNVGAPIAVQVALALSWAILTEAGLSFLGLGTQPPSPSLGLMVSDARNFFPDAWWTLLFPALAVVVAVVGLNMVGDGLRNALDPRRS